MLFSWLSGLQQLHDFNRQQDQNEGKRRSCKPKLFYRVPVEKPDVVELLKTDAVSQSIQMAEKLQSQQMLGVIHGSRAPLRIPVHFGFCPHWASHRSE